MLARLLLIFILVPLIELIILLRVGEILNVGPTLALIIVTGLVGASLARRQGIRILTRINAELTSGRLPTAELADGALVLLAGALLITPGFLTDLCGLAFLVPPFRARFRRILVAHFRSRLEVRTVAPFSEDDFLHPAAPGAGHDPPKHVANRAIDEA